MAAIKAITFDLWDTLVADDSDEAQRASRGLRTKFDERRQLLYEAINSAQPIEPDVVYLASDVANAAFNHVWHSQFVTWTVGQRVDVILKGLNRTLPAPVRQRLIGALESMEFDIPPDLIDGCEQALAELSSQYQLAVISDAIVTPGRLLRRLLEKHGVKQYFKGFAFSDEVGYSKPHRAMFESAAEQLDVALDEIVHVGDREHNDVRGAHALGIKAILFTATRDVDKQGSEADAVCDAYEALPGIMRHITS